MKVQVKFTVDVDWCDKDLVLVKPGDPLASRIEDAVEEAVGNALAYAQGEGHVHEMDKIISILMDSEVTATML